MTHVSIKTTNLFALDMVREALADPIVTFWYRNVRWQHVDITSNDFPAATITIARHRRRGNVTAHCEMEFENNMVVRGSMELIIGFRTWEFNGHLLNNVVQVHGTLVSK